MSNTTQQEPIQDEPSNQVTEQSVAELPGSRLREHRESNHLTREEVAHHLRLDAQLIKALEEDDYSHMPSPAYICGYLRSYARLLKLPEDQIVQAYSQGKQIQSVLIPQSVSILPKKSGVNFAFVKTLVIIIITVLVAGGLYLLADKFDIFTGGDRTQKRSEITVPAAPDSTQPPANETSAEAISKAPATTESTPVEQPVLPAPAKTEASKPIIEPLPTPKTKIPGIDSTATAEQATTTAAPPAAAAPTAAPPAREPEQQSSPAAIGPQTLRLHFLEASWAEVTDSAGNRLVYQLVEKNADLNLTGEPPFTILLGNAPGVQVFYKGKEFDHARFHRGEIAYFRVGVK